MNKEWELRATIKIKTSFTCNTKEEAEEIARKYLSRLQLLLYPDYCSTNYEIQSIESQESEVQDDE